MDLQAGQGTLEFGVPIAPGLIGLGQLHPGRCTSPVTQQPVSLDGEGQASKRTRRRSGRSARSRVRGAGPRLVECD